MHRFFSQHGVIILGCFILLLVLPLTFLGPREELSWHNYIFKCLTPLAMVFVFCLNYYWLIPRVFSVRKHVFFTANAAMIITCALLLAATHRTWPEQSQKRKKAKTEMTTPPPPPTSAEWAGGQQHQDKGMHKKGGKRKGRKDTARATGICNVRSSEKTVLHFRKTTRDGKKTSYFWFSTTILGSLNLILAASVAFALRSKEHIAELEERQREAEMARQEAELAGLRNNISPHFLLNTLNNIYALAQIDAGRTQSAVLQLSRLLRHILYDNRQEKVSLCSECDFLKDYIDLMKLRMPKNVKVSTVIDIDTDANTTVAPLIFISLVENAFKHGVAAGLPSFVAITVTEDERNIVCRTENSNNPKSSADRSGHGIGLQLVKQRLDALYAGRFTWEKGVSQDNVYYSYLTIKK